MPREILKPSCYDEHEVMLLPAMYRTAQQEQLPHSIEGPVGKLIDNAKFYCQQGYLMVIFGPEGSGKSFAAAVIAMKTMETGLRALWQNQWSLGDAQRWDQPYSASETILHRIQTVSLLVIDDLQPFTAADRFWTERELRILLRRRAEQRKSTIITTTMEPKDFAWMKSGVSNFLPLRIQDTDFTHRRFSEVDLGQMEDSTPYVPPAPTGDYSDSGW